MRSVEDEAVCAAPGVARPQSQPQPQLQEPTRITIGRGYTM
ncbi:hypothetical protein ACFXJ6_26355 [Streptomyces sp. NPDC059218]